MVCKIRQQMTLLKDGHSQGNNFGALLFLVFFSLYGPRLNLIDLMAMSTSLLAIVCLFKLSLQGYIEKFSLNLLFYLCAILLLSFFHYYISGKGDTTGIGSIFKQIIYFLSAYLIVEFAFNKYGEGARDKLYKAVVHSTALNGFCVIVFFIFPGISSFAASFLNYTRQLNWLDTGHRMFDLSLGGGASASFVFSLAFLLGLFLIQKKFNRYLLLSLIIIGISTLMMGRTGLYLIFVFLIGFLIINLKANMRKFFKFFILASFISILVIFFNKLNILNVDLSKFNDLIDWAFEMFINYSSSGSLESSTTNAISNMWFYPIQTEHFMYGDGNFGRTEFLPFIPSDVGYVRAIFGYGIIGAMLLSFLFIYIAATPFLIHKKNNFDTYLPLIMVILILLMNSKEFHYAARGSGIILFIVYLTTIFHIRNQYET